MSELNINGFARIDYSPAELITEAYIEPAVYQDERRVMEDGEVKYYAVEAVPAREVPAEYTPESCEAHRVRPDNVYGRREEDVLAQMDALKAKKESSVISVEIGDGSTYTINILHPGIKASDVQKRYPTVWQHAVRMGFLEAFKQSISLTERKELNL